MRRGRLVVVAILFGLAGAGLRLAAHQEPLVGPPDPLAPPALATCEAKMLDVQEELIKTQDALAQWQARAIRAEAQIALAEIGRQREQQKAGAVPVPPKE